MRDEILQAIRKKTSLEQKVFDNTYNTLLILKDALNEISSELNDELDLGKKVKIEYRDKGKFEAQLQIASDMLIFHMQTNVFKFNREHEMWNNAYVSGDPDNGYCGIINIYNFLTDSFKYNRNSDMGYLIGRIFINQENKYFVEGKRQLSLRHHDFGEAQVDKQALVDIVEAAVEYSLEFDPLVPLYDTVKLVSVEDLNTKFEIPKTQVCKRLGYEFNSDDI